jgi:hypothetical protein
MEMSVDKKLKKMYWMTKKSHVTASCLAMCTEKSKMLKSEVLAEMTQDYCLLVCDAV